MNDETKTWIMIVAAVVGVLTALALVASLPFAFVGWVLLTFINFFPVVIATSYFNSLITGLVVAILVGAFVK